MNAPAIGPSLIPGVYYDNLQSGVDWLISTLGFQTKASYNDPSGELEFAELAWGNGMIFVSRTPRTGPWAKVGKTCICLVANSHAVEEHYRQAVDAGARILRPLRRSTSPAFPDGVMGFDLEDPEGNLWTVSEYQPAR